MSTEPRAALVAAYKALDAAGGNQGSSGNLSLRLDAVRFLVTPTGVGSAALEPADCPIVTLDGRWAGPRHPSSEWRIHRDILAARPEVQAVVHAHPRHATALACLSEPIPAFHYGVAAAGGADIRVAAYATFGTEALSANVLAALEGRRACLIANHGIVAVGPSLAAALALALEVESLAATYLAARAAGTPVLLDAAEMARVAAAFGRYEGGGWTDPDLRPDPGLLDAPPLPR